LPVRSAGSQARQRLFRFCPRSRNREIPHPREGNASSISPLEGPIASGGGRGKQPLRANSPLRSPSRKEPIRPGDHQRLMQPPGRAEARSPAAPTQGAERGRGLSLVRCAPRPARSARERPGHLWSEQSPTNSPRRGPEQKRKEKKKGSPGRWRVRAQGPRTHLARAHELATGGGAKRDSRPSGPGRLPGQPPTGGWWCARSPSRTPLAPRVRAPERAVLPRRRPGRGPAWRSPSTQAESGLAEPVRASAAAPP